MSPKFYFATCQVGAEKAMKAEILKEFPHLNFAFSRPGFITFKEKEGDHEEITQTKSIFARLWGTVVGQAKDPTQLTELLTTVPERSFLHLFERDTFVPGDDPDDFVLHAKIKNASMQIPEAIMKRCQVNALPELGDEVYDLIWIDDFHVFLGRHVHHPALDQAPGNQPFIHLPKNAPSRAYLKIVEAIHRFKPIVNQGDSVLEVGCSPGGATTAMLKMGLKVTGVDPKYMDERLYSEKGFHFIQKLAKDITPQDLKACNPDWIVMDMNIAPLEAIDELNHVLLCLRKNHGVGLKLRNAFLTIKLNDWKFADSIPLYMRRLHECGFREMTATQLNSNRQEFFVMARKFKIPHQLSF
mgnify:CR=1 FL=1